MQLRKEAHDKGIPFVSVRKASADDLLRSLLPIFRLYAGEVGLKDVLRVRGPGGRMYKSRRIRL